MAKRLPFVLAALALIGAGLYFRTQNHQLAQAKASHVIELDAAATDTTAALTELKDFVKTHMGADVTFTLNGAYTRAQAAATAAAAAIATNSQIYADAQRLCSGKSDSITQARCNEDYLSKHLVAVPTTAPVTAPKLSDFQYHLRSPFWTPDLSGALLLGAVAALVIGLLVIGKESHSWLKRHHS